MTSIDSATGSGSSIVRSARRKPLVAVIGMLFVQIDQHTSAGRVSSVVAANAT